ncbi:MAG TPA: tetratricopeptide repeat protein [Myxococcus sp.]|nr:tetratricopeptide repeat protein [Myxococcus sp.]
MDPGAPEGEPRDEAADAEEYVPEDDPPGEPLPDEADGDVQLVRGKRVKDAVVPAAVRVPAAAPVPAEAPAAPPRPALSPVLAPRVSDADVLAVWDKWRRARATNDGPTADAAQAELVKLRGELGATNLEPISMGFLREAGVRRRAGDLTGAVRLAELAVELSPEMPAGRFALAEVYAVEAPGSVSRYLGQARAALVTLLSDARYRRPVLADLGALGLLAWVATAAALVGLLFVRRVRYALHDFHHLLPRAVARWQSALLGVLLLGLPLAMGLGGGLVLLVLLGVVALYLSRAERIVAAVMVAGLALVPLAAGQLARVTAFAGTPAEDVYLLERGGLSAEGAVARVLARQQARTASFTELVALAHYESRRGQLEDARTHFKAASALRSGDARLLTRFGNALVGLGDEEGAAQLYVQASQLDASLADPHYNLAQVYRRRAKTLPDSQVGRELDRAATAIAAAQSLDGELVRREPPPDNRLLLNQLLLAPGMREPEWLSLADGTEAGRQVESQLERWLLAGAPRGPVAWGMTVLLAAVAVLWGGAAGRLKAARECERCGRPVCTRCDPELGVGSKQCGQCVNVFARKGLVPQPLRARKQDQVDRYQAWGNRLSYALGALLSGAGHVASGVPVRGALHVFFFFFALAAVLLHQGLVRVPYGGAPPYLKLVPAVLLFLGVYVLSLRGLRRLRRDED